MTYQEQKEGDKLSVERLGMNYEDAKMAVTEIFKNIDNRFQEPDKANDSILNLEPGFLLDVLEKNAPEQGCSWQDCYKEYKEKIEPGTRPEYGSKYFSFFSTGFNYPSILADVISESNIASTWVSSPSGTELEVRVMDWLANALGLPEHFIHINEGPGGGIIQGNASDATLVTLVAARHQAIQRCKINGEDDSYAVLSRITAYHSAFANICVRRAGMIAMVNMKQLPVDKSGSLRAETFQQQIDEDIQAGCIPAYVCVTLGTTGFCSFDDLAGIGIICTKYNIWLHVDAAYAGTSFLCEENRYLMKGIKQATSFNFNAHKWLMVTPLCSPLWVKNKKNVIDAMIPNGEDYVMSQKSGDELYKMQTQLTRPFRALKLWYSLKIFGLSRLRERVREDIRVAKLLEGLVRKEPNFEVVNDVILGVVCMRVIQKGAGSITERVIKRIQEKEQIFFCPIFLGGEHLIRIVVGNATQLEQDVLKCWDVIKSAAQEVIDEYT